jgi:hypothetical protein
VSKTYVPIKPFKGYQAIDGSNHHRTLRDATEHSKTVVVKDALQAFASEVINAVDSASDMPGVVNLLARSESVDDGIASIPAIPLSADFETRLADFLFANRVELLAALSATVRTRKPRADAGKPRKPKASEQPAAA